MDPLLTAAQVAERLSVTTDWLYDEVQAGRFPHIRVGGRQLRFRPEDVESYLEARYVAAA